MQHELTFQVVLEAPPAGVDYGLQVGRGADYETAQKQRSTGTDLRFEFTVGVKSRRPDVPDFRGPVVQGPLGQRFIYIDIGTYAGQTDTPWSRRLKVPLIGITWDVIDRALATRMVLETRVPGYNQVFTVVDARFVHSVTIVGHENREVAGSALGFNVGADVAHFFTANIGIGGVVRFSRGTVDVDKNPLTGEPMTFEAGHMSAGGGLRLRF